MIKKMTLSGLFYFIVIIFLGIILRVKMVTAILPEFQFMHLVHAHSHVAFLGWVYFILLAILLSFCLPKEVHEQRLMKLVYFGTHISVIGMLISFSLQGYALYSIIFSTLHIFLSYLFGFIYFKHNQKPQNPVAYWFFHTAVVIMLLSSFGPWCVAVVAAKGLADTPIFNVFIYLYLHLQYNGWFTFMIMGASYILLGHNNVSLRSAKLQYWTLAAAVFPSFLPAIMWYGLPVPLIGIGIIGAILQLFSTILFLKSMWKGLLSKTVNKSSQLLLHLAFLSLGVKSLMECLEAWPALSEMIPSNRQVILGYLHLTLLGFISSFLLYYLYMHNNVNKIIRKSGAVLYTIGTVSMIFLLFFAGLLQWLHLPQPIWLWISLVAASIIAGGGVLIMVRELMVNSQTVSEISQQKRPVH